MAEYRLVAEQPGALIDVEIVARIGEQLFHIGDLGVVLAEMGLHIGVGKFARERARGLQLGFARRDREPRRNRVVEASAPTPALQKRLALVVAALRSIGKRGGGVAVHHHLARDHASAAALGFAEKGVHRFWPHRAIDRRCRCALTNEFVEKETRDDVGMLRVRELLLFHKRVFLQPVEQLRAVGADHARLRIVNMRVDEAGQNQLAGVIVDSGAPRCARQHIVR